MPVNKNESRKPKAWEILGAVIGYFAVAKDVPDVFKILMISKMIPCTVKNFLLVRNPSTDFWYLIFFTISFLVFLLTTIWRDQYVYKLDETLDSRSVDEEILQDLNRAAIIGFIKSFGFSLIRRIALGYFRVSLYGTFKRPIGWKEKPKWLKSIDRITFENGRGFEFQYAWNFKVVSFREHPEKEDQYGKAVERVPTWDEIKLLIVASNIFPFWFIPHLFTRIRWWVYLVFLVCFLAMIVMSHFTNSL